MGEHTSECRQILALDGGGIRGIFTASFLSAIESTNGTPVADSFDLIAGTSAGGLIALALGAGYRPAEIVGFFRDRGQEIFPPQSKLTRIASLPRRLLRSKYSDEPLKRALQAYFEDRPLGASRKRLIIPAYDSTRGGIYIFKTPHHRDLRTDYKVPMWEVAYATAAAPTYFPAYISDTYVRLVDGGIWANNPAMVALAEGLGYLEWHQQSISLLSVGSPHKPLSHGSRRFGDGFWAWRSALRFLMAGQSSAATNECLHILTKDRFCRVDPVVGKDYALDRIAEDIEGIGVTEARNQVNEIRDRYLQHSAAPYEPLYRTDERVVSTCRKGGAHEQSH